MPKPASRRAQIPAQQQTPRRVHPKLRASQPTPAGNRGQAPPANRPGRYLFRTPAQLRRRTAAQRRTRKRRNPLRRNSQTVSLHTIFCACPKPNPSTSSIKRASSSCILFTSITKSVYQSQRYEKYRMRETVCPQIAKNSPMQLDDYFPNRKNYVYLCFGCKTERKTFERTPHPLCCIYPH